MESASTIRKGRTLDSPHINDQTSHKGRSSAVPSSADRSTARKAFQKQKPVKMTGAPFGQEGYHLPKHVRNSSSTTTGSSASTSANSFTWDARDLQVNGHLDPINLSSHAGELFPFARARLDNLAYSQMKTHSQAESSLWNPRREILKTVFGWEQDIQDLIWDELNNHPYNTLNAFLISKWLGDTGVTIATPVFASSTLSTSKYSFFALRNMNGQVMTNEVGRTLARKVLKKGDIHVAATTLISIGELEDAIDMYTSHQHYMEAILLTCLEFPNDWHRQSALVRRWGEHIMLSSRQLLAMRCLSCTNGRRSDSWRSVNTAMAELLVKYTQRLSWPSSTSSTLSPPVSLVFTGPSSTLTRGKSQPILTGGGESQQSVLKLVTSSGIQNSTFSVTCAEFSHRSTANVGPKARYDTPHPDFSGPCRTKDEVFKAELEKPRHGSDLTGLKPEGLAIQFLGFTEHAEVRAEASSSSMKSTAASYGESERRASPAAQSLAAIGALMSPMSKTDRKQRTARFVESLAPATSHPQPHLLERATELEIDQASRGKSVERGRSTHRIHLTQRIPSASVIESRKGKHGAGVHISGTKGHTMSDPQTHSETFSNRAYGRSKVRAGSEPSHHRLSHLPRHNLERPASLEKDKSLRRDRMADRRRHHGGGDAKWSRKNSMVRHEKSLQRGVEPRKEVPDHGPSSENAGRQSSASTPKKLNSSQALKEFSFTELQDGPRNVPSNVSTNFVSPTPSLPQVDFPVIQVECLTPIDALSNNKISDTESRVTFPKIPTTTLSDQFSAISHVESRSTQTSSELTENIVPMSEKGRAFHEASPRPNSYPPSPDQPFPRPVDFCIHPAFLRNIQPSSMRHYPAPPARRDPIHGSKPSLGAAWERLESLNETASQPAMSAQGLGVVVDESRASQVQFRANRRGGRVFSDGITNTFRAMAERVRSPSRGKDAIAKSTGSEEGRKRESTDVASNNFKALADRVRSPSLGKRDGSTSSSYQPGQRAPYESLPEKSEMWWD